MRAAAQRSIRSALVIGGRFRGSATIRNVARALQLDHVERVRCERRAASVERAGRSTDAVYAPAEASARAMRRPASCVWRAATSSMRVRPRPGYRLHEHRAVRACSSALRPPPTAALLTLAPDELRSRQIRGRSGLVHAMGSGSSRWSETCGRGIGASRERLGRLCEGLDARDRAECLHDHRRSSASWQIVWDLAVRLLAMLLPARGCIADAARGTGRRARGLVRTLDVTLPESAWYDYSGP